MIGVDNKQQLQANIIKASDFKEISLPEVDKIEVVEEELLNPTNWS